MNRSLRDAVILITLTLFAGCRWIEGDARWTSLDPDYALEVHSVDDQLQQETTRRFAGPQPVEALVDQAILASAELQAAYLRVEANRNRTSSARWLDDPRVALTVGVEPVQTASGQQDFSVAVSQPLKRPRKWDAQVALAQNEVDYSMALAEKTRLAVAEQTRRGYADLYEAQTVAQRLAEQRDLIETVARLARVKYENGAIGERQWRQVTLELIEMDQRIQAQHQAVSAARVKLAGVIGLPPLTPITSLDRLPMVELPGERRQYFELALQANPALQARMFAMRRAQVKVELASQERHPDPTVNATWIDTSRSGISPVANGQDAVLLGVSMGLPIYRQRLYAQVDEARAEASSAVMDFREERIRQQTQIEMLYDSIQLLQAQISQLDLQLMPEAEQTYRSSLQQFEGDLVTLDDVLDDAQRILQVQIDRARLEAKLYRAQATIIRHLGGSLPQLATQDFESPSGEEIDPQLFPPAVPAGFEQQWNGYPAGMGSPELVPPIPTSSRRIEPFTNYPIR